MPDIDPFAREALRRAAQMNRRTKAPEAPKPEPLKEAVPEEPHKTRESQSHQPTTHPPEPEHTSADGVLGALFKDKDSSIILLLIVLLMGEDSNPSLLLALMFLLI